MRKHLKIFLPIGITIGVLALIAAVPGPPSTTFTRGFMVVTNQAQAQAYLGVGGTNTVTNDTMIITNALTLQPIKTNILATTSTGLVTNMVVGSGLAYDTATRTLSATASGGGASVWVPNTTLTYSGGTNVTIDGSGGTNFFLVLSNTAFFTTPANVPASKSTNTSFTVFFQQDGTGTWDVTYTNASFKWPGGVNGAFKPTTNANSVSWVTFTMSPFTNGIFLGDYGVLDSR